jgi:hypothetical protein
LETGGVKRSKHMDEWTVAQLAAWLSEMKMDEYIPLVQKNRVDGLLFVSLSETERQELGIHNAFHKRKLAVILNSFQTRYARRRAGQFPGEHEEDLSEYALSELSGILEQEDVVARGDLDIDSSSDVQSELEADSYESGDSPDEELLQVRKMDQLNVEITVSIKGNEIEFPVTMSSHILVLSNE